ncbi:hypothetical protein [Haloterrigena salinisoli]|uniref:hypothetical protein n=1 Tax=Haloterrigena salinisoli TaxID=3132747 RepID=UPI0030D18855
MTVGTAAIRPNGAPTGRSFGASVIRSPDADERIPDTPAIVSRETQYAGRYRYQYQ